MPRSIRLRLMLAISAVSTVAVGASFLALHEVTGADLRGRIDDELHDQQAEFEQVVPASARADPKGFESAARKFVAGQRYHPESRIFAIAIDGGPEVTNQREIVEGELEHEASAGEEDEGTEREGSGLLDAPAGLATVSTEETGPLRVLTAPLDSDGRRVGTFRVADPLSSVDQALDGLRNTFLIVGAVTLALAIAVAIWLANLISGPLRRMAGVASRIDSGDLSGRIEYEGADEVGALADAFNGMLNRLESGFRRQREFVSDASHELRSPLTVLRGRIELLARRSASEEIGEEAAELMREVSRMDRLVEDLLTLARAESGTLVQRRPISVEDLVEDLRRDMPLLGARNSRVDSTARGILEADPDRLSQVLRNLISNAVRHGGPDGEVRISVETDDGRTRFAVSDDGPGIPPEQLDRVFDRFHRVDEGRGREEGGSGLGLAIAKAIVGAHGGSIRAESPRGKGATISFEIPGYRPAPGATGGQS